MLRRHRSGTTWPKRSGSQKRLVAATGPDHHVSVLLQDDVGAVVKVEDRYGVELGGCAARLRHRVRVDEMNLQATNGNHGERRRGLLRTSIVL